MKAMRIIISLLLALLCFQAPAWAQEADCGSTLSVKPTSLSLTGTRVQLGLEICASNLVVTGVRLDNVGGQMSLWRSDGRDSLAAPIEVFVPSMGEILAQQSNGSNLMQLQLGDKPTLFDLRLEDNGAFAGGQTQFRVTVFLSRTSGTAGPRLQCLLNPADFLKRGGSAAPAATPATPAAPAPAQPTGADKTAPPPDTPPAGGQPSAGGQAPPALQPPATPPADPLPSGSGESGGSVDGQTSDGKTPGDEQKSDGDTQRALANPDDWAYASFRLAMDKAFGAGYWNDQGHSFAAPLLTVKGLRMTEHKVGEAVYPAGEAAEVRVTSIVRPEVMRKILSEGSGEATPVAGEIAVTGLKLQSAEPQSLIAIASLSLRDASPAGQLAELAADGFEFQYREKASDAPMTAKLGSFSLVNLDYSKLLADAQSSVAEGARLTENLLMDLFSLNTLDELFVTSYSLDQGVMKNAEMSLGSLNFKIAEGRLEGPLTAGQIASSMVASLTGVELTLPASQAEAAKMGLPQAYDVAQALGLSTIVLDLEAVNQYNPSTGVVTRELRKLNARDLFDWSFKLQLGGLTPERLAVLQKTGKNDLLSALLNPSGELAHMALDELSFKFEDHSLFERLYKGQGVSNKMASSMGQTVIVEYGSDFLNDAVLIGQALADFLNNPGRLELSLKPNPPLSTASASTMKDFLEILNSLNAALTVNDKSSQPIVFKSVPQF